MMRKNIRILNIFCEAAATTINCDDPKIIESTISEINEIIIDYSNQLKQSIRDKIENMPAPQKKGFIQRFWDKLNPSTTSQQSSLGVLGQVHEQLKTKGELYYDILILEALYNKEIGRKIFNEAAQPPDARVFTLINKSIDDFFAQFIKHVDDSAAVLLNNKATPEDINNAINNLNHIAAATDQDAKKLEKQLEDFIGNATKSVINGAEQNIQRDKNGNPLSFIQRSANWLTGGKASNAENKEDIKRKEKEYIFTYLNNNATAPVNNTDFEDGDEHLQYIYDNYPNNEDPNTFAANLNDFSIRNALNNRQIEIIKLIDKAQNEIQKRKERYGSHLGGLSESSNVELLKGYNRKGKYFLTDAIASSCKEVFNNLLKDPDFRTMVFSITKCLQGKASGLHNIKNSNITKDYEWIPEVDEFYRSLGHELDDSSAENIKGWMRLFATLPNLATPRNFVQDIRRLSVPQRLAFQRLTKPFKYVLNMAYNSEFNLPPPQPFNPTAPTASTTPAPPPKP